MTDNSTLLSALHSTHRATRREYVLGCEGERNNCRGDNALCWSENNMLAVRLCVCEVESCGCETASVCAKGGLCLNVWLYFEA